MSSIFTSGLISRCTSARCVLSRSPLSIASAPSAGNWLLARQLREFGNGLVLEHLPGGKVDSCFARLGDHLDAEDRVSTQLEEVVVYAHTLNIEQFGPDPAQNLFDWSARAM